MAKANYSGYLLSCLIILLVAQFGVATVLPLLGGKKLIIGLPYKSAGFTEKYVDVELDPRTKQLVQVSGFSIHIFSATLDYLSHSGLNVSYEFRPFINETGQSAGTYDQLVEQVFKQQVSSVNLIYI